MGASSAKPVVRARPARTGPVRASGSGKAGQGASAAKNVAKRSVTNDAVKRGKQIAGVAKYAMGGGFFVAKDVGAKNLGKAEEKLTPYLKAQDRAKRGLVARRGGKASPMLATAAPSATGSTALTGIRAAKNLPKDAQDTLVHMPASFYYLGKTAAKGDVKGVGKMLADPYVKLAKNPRKELEERPFGTALTVIPTGKAASLGAGRVARKAGIQTLDGGVRKVPGTAIESPVTNSRGIVGNALEQAAARGGKAPKTKTARIVNKGRERAPVSREIGSTASAKVSSAPGNMRARIRRTNLTDSEVARKVDEFAGYQRREIAAAENRAANIAKEQNPVPRRRPSRARVEERKVAKARRADAMASAVDEARKTAQRIADREFVERFGATQRPTALESTAKTLAEARNKAVATRKKLSAKNRDLYMARKAAEDAAKVARRKQPSQDGAVMKRGSRRAASRGVPPKEADALLRAIAAQEANATRLRRARAMEKATKANARTARLAKQKAGLVDEQPMGRTFASKTDAQQVARLAPFDAVVQRVGDEWGVVPKVAKLQRQQHGTVGTSPATGAIALRKIRRLATPAVLAFKPASWLTGQVVEPTFRAVATGATPLDAVRFNRRVRELNRIEPGLGDKFRHATTTGGTGAMVHELQGLRDKTWAQVADESKRIHKGSVKHGALKGASRIGQTAPVRGALAANDRYANFVFNTINAKGIESPFQSMFAGRAMRRNLPEMDNKLVSFRKKDARKWAEQMAADPKKLRAAEERVGRGVKYDYGQYADFSPGMREALLHWTYFAPWAMNAAKWSTTAPFKRPGLGIAMSAANRGSEEWRKENGLSRFAKEQVPSWQRTMLPINGDLYNAGRYLPFSIAQDPAQQAASLFLPTVVPAFMASRGGVDWKGTQIREGAKGESKPATSNQRLAYAAANLAASHFGPAGIANDTFKLVDRKILGKTDVSTDYWRNFKNIYRGPFMGLNEKKMAKASADGKITPAEMREVLRKSAAPASQVSPEDMRQAIKQALEQR